ncbi:MAG: SpoIIE family protein phosphatase [Blastocatellia bacterium]|nr:SpoIIE family protein phosphatase [Blastocatellia bacterium]
MSKLSTQDFSANKLSASLLWLLVFGFLGFTLTLLLFSPYSFASATRRSLQPSEAYAVGVGQLKSFNLKTQDKLVTVTAGEDKQLIIYIRDTLGVSLGNEVLSSRVAGIFWEIELRESDKHTTALENPTSTVMRIEDYNQISNALVRIDERGNWFQFYQRPKLPEESRPRTKRQLLEMATEWAELHQLLLTDDKTFSPSKMEEPKISETEVTIDGKTAKLHRFEWPIESEIAQLEQKVVLEVVGEQISYYGIEFNIPESYKSRSIFWRLAFVLRVLLSITGLVFCLWLIIKQLRRDAIDFQFSFTYSAIVTFPIIAIIISKLPSLMNEEITVAVRENFYLLSSSTFIWLILLMLSTPLVALNDSLVRQIWPEKLSNADAIIQGHFRLNSVGQAVLTGFGAGLILTGLVSITDLIVVRFGGYSHQAFISPLTGAASGIWVFFGSLSVAIVFGYLMLFIATLTRLKLTVKYAATVTSIIWLIAISSTSDFYSGVVSFLPFAIITTATFCYLAFRYDLVTVVVAVFANFACLGTVQLLTSSNQAYFFNGVTAFFLVSGLAIAGHYIAKDKRVYRSDFVPDYITRLQSRERIEHDIEIARQLQFQFLPQQVPSCSYIKVATICKPAYEVGGDYYDFIELGQNRLGLVIADVSGKGIPAAFYMTMIKGIMQSQTQQEISPKDLLKRVNRVIYKCTGSSTFVTLFYAIIDTEKATLVYSNAGHNPPLVVSSDGKVRELCSGGMVLGIMPHPEYEEEAVDLVDGDILLLYTDGVVETTDLHGVEFGSEKLATTIQDKRDLSVSDLLEEICKDVDSFAAGTPQTDDLTMILLTYNRDEETYNSN